jgi:hypothetical protein
VVPRAPVRSRPRPTCQQTVKQPHRPQTRGCQLPVAARRAIPVLGYPLTAVLGEKIEPMVRGGGANTRDRDFPDVALLGHRR